MVNAIKRKLGFKGGILLGLFLLLAIIIVSIYLFNSKYDYYVDRVTIVIVAVCILFVILFYLSMFDLFKFLNWKYVFSIAYITISFMYLVLTPCNMGFDESGHFLRSYEVSKGHMTSGHFEDGSGASYCPSELHDALWDVLDGVKQNDANGVYEKQQQCMNHSMDMSSEEQFFNVNQALYSPVSYIPQVIGLFIGNLFLKNGLVYYYMGRTVGLIINVLFVLIAVWIIPDRKGLVALIASTPMFLSQICTYSADGTINAFSLFYVAYILYVRSKEHISVKNMVVIFIGSGVVALSKVIYFPLVLLVFLIPSDIFKCKKEELIFKILNCLFAVVLFFIWFNIAKSYLYDASVRGVYPDMQLSYLIKHIYLFPVIILKTIALQWKDWVVLLFGGCILSLNVVYATKMPFILAGITLIEMISNEDRVIVEKNALSIKLKLIALISVLMILGLTFSSLYVQWTPYMNDTIVGIQGRYFIPLLLPVALVLKRFNILKNYKVRLGLEWIAVMMMTMYALAFEYYIFT